MQTLQKAGWRTGAFGKVHFHPHFAGLYPDCAQIRSELRDRLLEMIILQDYPKPRRDLYALGVH